MSSWNHSFAADEHTSYTTRQGVDQASPIESTYTEGSTYTDGCTYPDPTGFGRQTPSNYADTVPKSSHHYGPYFQPSDFKANEVQADDPFEGDEYWSRQSETWDADQEKYWAELDPFPEIKQHSDIHGHSGSHCQLSTATTEQTRENLPNDASSSRKANLPMETANIVAPGSIYPGAYPFGYAQHYISYSKPTLFPGSISEEPQHNIYSVGYPFRYPPQGLSYPVYPSSSSEEKAYKLLDRPCSPGNGFEQPSQRLSDNDSLSASDHQSASSLKKRKRTSRAQRSSPSKRSRTAYNPQGEHVTMGSDRRPRAETKVENGVLFGLVDNEWSKFERLESAPIIENNSLAEPAGYHLDFRVRLILKDAQQLGAPAPPLFQQGIPPNYTSYSPITQGWNDDDLTSMRDSQGRHAFLMPHPPTDWQHNPVSGYMMYNGLVMLDQNNRPLKDYPGAPLTISYDADASLVEGLRRYFGMTYPDITGRMPPERHTSTGVKPIRGITLLSTRISRWYKRHKDKGLGPWHDRRKHL